MLLILDHYSTQPDWNLAAEEYLLTRFGDSLFRLWRNAPCIIVGRHQNTWAEVNVPYVQQHHIPVIRRLSGGGAVFHDLGNINYSFMEPKPQGEATAGTFHRCTRPILDALNHIGIPACLSGRNDLIINGKKFSGTAQCQMQGRILLHGTLLYTSVLSHIGQALQGPCTKFSKKAVPSTPSPICNISSHLNNALPVEQFMDYLADYMGSRYPNMQPYTYTSKDLAAIQLLADSKYGTFAWNWGEEPQYAQQMELKTSSGNLQLHFDLNFQGLISRIRIYGDYVAPIDREVLEALLIGSLPDKEALMRLLP
ncbi:MAG: lipoate--protein ligase [Bacteroidetes bacterium]|nr:lipoate--protein ligase [Bacteroidota bacterium]